MLNRRMIVTVLAAVLFCTTITNDALATPFLPGDFITWSQDEWGTQNSTASQLLFDHLSDLYPNGVEIGIPGAAGSSAIFTTLQTILGYLPAGAGCCGPLDNDYLDPTSTSAGVFGGYVLAMQFNVDFNDAGFLTGSSGDLFGDLVLHSLANYPDFNGLSVRQFLLEINSILGGSPPPYSYDDIGALTGDLLSAFESGTPSQFAEDHLQLPDGVPQPVPEPASLGLLGIGLAILTALRFKGKGRNPSAVRG